MTTTPAACEDLIGPGLGVFAGNVDATLGHRLDGGPRGFQCEALVDGQIGAKVAGDVGGEVLGHDLAALLDGVQRGDKAVDPLGERVERLIERFGDPGAYGVRNRPVDAV